MGTKIETEFTVDANGVLIKGDEPLRIDRTDLREGGWIPADQAEDVCTRDHCDTNGCDEHDLEAAREALKRWHDEEPGHLGAFRFCYSEPCKSVGDHL